MDSEDPRHEKANEYVFDIGLRGCLESYVGGLAPSRNESLNRPVEGNSEVAYAALSRCHAASLAAVIACLPSKTITTGRP